ncbi:aspartate aminotransferase family protein [Pseudoteredinibacter isoporae]|uniref:Acetylornithine aminotransferase n=1 Tax=Pseudoteredinibacter isoporae TaxID=570281 RepID=A0A7X0JWI8_9GAMM|nr:aspartate aminotransferase family protein [Pseudoteredinibacter isoporae]MBB6523528.1 acetylornithine aminotransferase [Pseudoteredinibacter isoporae]NHO89037.1 aspartate aminotransferase family protein [Pseudoteredinibacter isoporae]NIB22352.1 aspartate aminotransferase family protein [Pseudoteredinibacter isoporae]
MSQYLMNNYGERSHSLNRGEGCYLFDDSGQRYLDALSGIAVCGLGHCHPQVTRAITEQAQTLLHTSNLFNIEQQEKLAHALCEISGMEKAFFSNSGAEANEAAIKISRLYAEKKGITDPVVIVTEGSFHGRTMATLSATGNPKVRQGFAPLVQGFKHVPYNEPVAIAEQCKSGNVVAVLIEPVQGEGGVRVPDADYLTELRQICDQYDCLLMLDEIQTGNARTGRYFAFQHSDIRPDVLTTAKGLGNGVPIGACLASGVAAELLQAGTHGSTYGGNPLVCATALATVTELRKDSLLDNVNARSQQLFEGLRLALKECPRVKDIRGKGLMVGIELDQPCGQLVEQAWQKGLIINVTAGNTVRLLPPLIINEEHIEQLVNTVSELIRGI